MGENDETVCAPAEDCSPFAWDGADNMVFRPLAELFAMEASSEAINVDALDEEPDSAWFTNRLGTTPMSPDELARGGCRSEQVLDPSLVSDGAGPGPAVRRAAARRRWSRDLCATRGSGSKAAAAGPLVAQLYDLGLAQGHRLVGIERPTD